MTEIKDDVQLRALVNLEGRLLDEWRLDEWLALFHEGCRYWIPIDETKDPVSSSSILYEDHESLELRIDQLCKQQRVSQVPRSNLLHHIGSIELQINREHARAQYPLAVFEVRTGDYRQSGLGRYLFRAGTCEIRFIRTGEGWRILEKKILLLDRHLPQESLSYLL